LSSIHRSNLSKESGVEVIQQCKLGIQALKSNDKSIESIIFNEYNREIWIENLWIGEWHEIMKKRRFNYDSIEERLKALKLLKNKFIYPSWYKEGVINTTTSPFTWREKNSIIELSCCRPGCYIVSKDMKYCRGCKNLVYCSNECQIKHWKIHKLDCKKL
jgi:hypothetical protein